MPGIERKSGESLESLLKRFRRELSESGVLRDHRRHQRFLSKSELKRDKMRKAVRRLRRRQSRQRGPSRGSRTS